MADDWMFHGGGKTAVRQPNPGEVLFELTRLSDGAAMTCVLRNHGRVYGYEIQVLENGEFIYGHGAFTTREVAIRWAEDERRRLETQRYG